MTIDHIGVVVPSLEAGIEQWKDLFGYEAKSDIVLNTRQQVRVIFLGKPGSLTIKLIEPSSAASAVTAFAKRGGGLHHLCFKCDSITEEMPRMKANGARVIVQPQPGEAFNGHDIAMLLAKNNLAIELIDTAEKHGRQDSTELTSSL